MKNIILKIFSYFEIRGFYSKDKSPNVNFASWHYKELPVNVPTIPIADDIKGKL